MANMQKYRILCVDDEPYVCDFLKDYLLFKGYDVQVAFSGKQALQILAAEKFDMLLLDIIMPEMSGMEVLQNIHENIPHLPVIILTGVKDQNIAAETARLGALDYITKPIDLDLLEQSIRLNLKV